MRPPLPPVLRLGLSEKVNGIKYSSPSPFFGLSVSARNPYSKGIKVVLTGTF